MRLDYGKVFTPYLAVDCDALERNLAAMREFASGTGVNVRPHAKTHKCSELARLQVRYGSIGVTCAKLGEAEAMAQGGITDILIANQVVGREKLLRLAELCLLHDVKVAIDCQSHAQSLSQAAAIVGSEVGVLVEVDVGMGRCGVRSTGDALALVSLVKSLPGLRFRGLLGYEGHTVMLTPRETRLEACTRANMTLVSVRRFLEDHGHRCEIVSGGGTGTYDMTGSFDGMTEIEPGSYVFMDAKYRTLDLPFEQALHVVATVVSTPQEGLAIVDAGLKTMTTESGKPVAAAYLSNAATGGPSLHKVQEGELEVAHLSEEHTKLAGRSVGRLAVGDKVLFVPSHICTTVNLYDYYHVFRQGKFLTRWRIDARGAAY